MGWPHGKHLPCIADVDQSTLVGWLAAQGRVHLLEGHRHGELRRLDGVPVECCERLRSQPRARVVRYAAQLSAGRCVGAPVRHWETMGDNRSLQYRPWRVATEWR